jgi:hypothetical protein
MVRNRTGRRIICAKNVDDSLQATMLCGTTVASLKAFNLAFFYINFGFVSVNILLENTSKKSL